MVQTFPSDFNPATDRLCAGGYQLVSHPPIMPSSAAPPSPSSTTRLSVLVNTSSILTLSYANVISADIVFFPSGGDCRSSEPHLCVFHTVAEREARVAKEGRSLAATRQPLQFANSAQIGSLQNVLRNGDAEEQKLASGGSNVATVVECSCHNLKSGEVTRQTVEFPLLSLTQMEKTAAMPLVHNGHPKTKAEALRLGVSRPLVINYRTLVADNGQMLITNASARCANTFTERENHTQTAPAGNGDRYRHDFLSAAATSPSFCPQSSLQYKHQHPPIYCHALSRAAASIVGGSTFARLPSLDELDNQKEAANAAVNEDGANAETDRQRESDGATTVGGTLAFSAGFYPTANLQWMAGPLLRKPIYTLVDERKGSAAEANRDADPFLPATAPFTTITQPYEDVSLISQQTLASGEKLIFAIDRKYSSTIAPTSIVLKIGLLRFIEDPSSHISAAGEALAIEWVAGGDLSAAPPLTLPESLFVADENAVSFFQTNGGVLNEDSVEVFLFSHLSLGQRSVLFVRHKLTKKCCVFKLTLAMLPHMKIASLLLCEDIADFLLNSTSDSNSVSGGRPSVSPVAGLPHPLYCLLPTGFETAVAPPVALFLANGECLVVDAAALLKAASASSREEHHNALILGRFMLCDRAAATAIAVHGIAYSEGNAVGLQYSVISSAASQPTSLSSRSANRLQTMRVSFPPLLSPTCDAVSCVFSSALSFALPPTEWWSSLVAMSFAQCHHQPTTSSSASPLPSCAEPRQAYRSLEFDDVASLLRSWAGVPVALASSSEQQPQDPTLQQQKEEHNKEEEEESLSELLEGFLLSSNAGGGSNNNSGAVDALLRGLQRHEPANVKNEDTDNKSRQEVAKKASSVQSVATAVIALHLLVDGLLASNPPTDAPSEFCFAEGNAATSSSSLHPLAFRIISTILLPITAHVLRWTKYAAYYRTLLGDVTASCCPEDAAARSEDTESSSSSSSASLTRHISLEWAVNQFGVGIARFVRSGAPPCAFEMVKEVTEGNLLMGLAPRGKCDMKLIDRWPLLGVNSCNIASFSSLSPAVIGASAHSVFAYICRCRSPSSPHLVPVAMAYVLSRDDEFDNCDSDKEMADGKAANEKRQGGANRARKMPWWVGVSVRYTRLLGVSPALAVACRESAPLGIALPLREALAIARAEASSHYFEYYPEVLAAIGRTDVLNNIGGTSSNTSEAPNVAAKEDNDNTDSANACQQSSASRKKTETVIIIRPPSDLTRQILSSGNAIGDDDEENGLGRSGGGGAPSISIGTMLTDAGAIIREVSVSSPSAAVGGSGPSTLQHALHYLSANTSVKWFTSGENDSVLCDTVVSNTWGDARLDVVQTLLNTAVPIMLAGKGGESADGNRTELAAMIKKALVLPIARGMLTLSTENFRLRDTIPIPPLVLDGHTSDGIQVRVETLPPLSWPRFHNGCAAGLRFLGKHSRVSRSWINYQTREDDSFATAGLMLSLGLLGHLRCLESTDIYAILQRRKDHSAIALMLGLAATYRGTNNEAIMPCLSMHVESLTHTADDMEVPIGVQTTALIAIGLVRQASCDGFLVEMLLGEISRHPTDQHAHYRASYALGAGIALGLITLGQGPNQRASVSDRLIAFMKGDEREGLQHRYGGGAGMDGFSRHHDRYGVEADPRHGFSAILQSLADVREQSAGVCQNTLEGRAYNKAVTGPASVVALGLMYLRTNDPHMAAKVKLPNNLFELKGVTPELALLRVLMGSLIHFNAIGSTKEWIYSSNVGALPFVLGDLFALRDKSHHSRSKGGASRTSPCVTRMDHLPPEQQYLMLLTAYAITGACLAIAFKHAGAMHNGAKETILAELRGFADGKLGSTGIALSPIQIQSGVFETCIGNCAVALGIAMAGKADVTCLDVLRRLFDRPASITNSIHQPVAMAVGLLFLGGGKCTLSNSTESLASLLIAFYPMWSSTQQNNNGHTQSANGNSSSAFQQELLQPLRHFYAAAAVPSVLEVKDAVSGESINAFATIYMNESETDEDDELRSGPHDPTEVNYASRESPFERYNREVLRNSQNNGGALFSSENVVENETQQKGKSTRQKRTHRVYELTPCLMPSASSVSRIEITSPSHYSTSVMMNRRAGFGGGGAEVGGNSNNSVTIALVPRKPLNEAGGGDGGVAGDAVVAHIINKQLMASNNKPVAVSSFALGGAFITAPSEAICAAYLRKVPHKIDCNVKTALTEDNSKRVTERCGRTTILFSMNLHNILSMHRCFHRSSQTKCETNKGSLQSCRNRNSAAGAVGILSSDFVANLNRFVNAILLQDLLTRTNSNGSLLKNVILGGFSAKEAAEMFLATSSQTTATTIHNARWLQHALILSLGAMLASDSSELAEALISLSSSSSSASTTSLPLMKAIQIAMATGVPSEVAMALA